MPKKTSKKDKSTMSNLSLLGVGLLSFALTLGAGATGTYAWFTVSKFASITIVKFGVDEDTDLKMGMKNADGTIEYLEHFNDEDLARHNVGYVPGSDLMDVSSMYQKLWLNEATDYEHAVPQLRTGYTGNSKKESYLATNGYHQFEFYFLAAENTYLFLAPDQTSVKAMHAENLDRIASLGSDTTKTVEQLDKVENAARVSFFSEDGYYIYEPNAETGSTTTFGGTLDVAPSDGYYDNEFGHEIVYGEYEEDDKIVYGDPSSEESESPEQPSSFDAKHAAGIRPFDYQASRANGFDFAQERTYTLNQLGLEENQGQFDPSQQQPIAKLHAGVPHRLVVTIYIEGWDRDVTTGITGGKFATALGFRGLAAPFND